MVWTEEQRDSDSSYVMDRGTERPDNLLLVSVNDTGPK